MCRAASKNCKACLRPGTRPTPEVVMNPDQDAYNMIDTGPEDDFERLLRQQLQAQQDYLPDDGFSAQVMAALPAASAKSRWRERLLIGVPVLLISLLVFSQLPWLDMAYIA